MFDGYWQLDPRALLIRAAGYILRFVVRRRFLRRVVRLFYAPESHFLDEHYCRLLVPKQLV